MAPTSVPSNIAPAMISATASAIRFASIAVPLRLSGSMRAGAEIDRTDALVIELTTWTSRRLGPHGRDELQ
jgi:hypothetical protein